MAPTCWGFQGALTEVTFFSLHVANAAVAETLAFGRCVAMFFHKTACLGQARRWFGWGIFLFRRCGRHQKRQDAFARSLINTGIGAKVMLQMPHLSIPSRLRHALWWVGNMATAALLNILGGIGAVLMAAGMCRSGSRKACQNHDVVQPTDWICCAVFHDVTDSRYVNTLPFSSGVHSRLSTSLQLRLNHLLTFAASVKRAGLALGEIG